MASRHKRLFLLLPVCLIFLFLTLSVFSGCDGFDLSSLFSGKEKLSTEIRLTKEEDRFADFANGRSKDMKDSNNYSNGFPFNCTWRNYNVIFENGVMALKLTKNNDKYEGAEEQSYWNEFHYGFYSVEMKAAKGSGVVSSFFLYTGYPWDEIDIEFLGYDTTKVQFNYYTNGVGGHEYLYDLGYDASEEFHEYAFDWREGYIEWYVDGKAVHKATKNLPSHKTRLMTNIWTGVGDTFLKWCGPTDDSAIPAVAEYRWIGYTTD